MSRQDFVDSVLPVAEAYQSQTGIPAAVLIAINASESNWGAAGGNELFGVKGSGLTASTWEEVNGQAVPTVASFQTYGSASDAYAGFIGLVSSGRYQSAWNALQQTGDWQRFLHDINAAGYATDPSWADKIISLAQSTIAPMIGDASTGANISGDITAGPVGSPQGWPSWLKTAAWIAGGLIVLDAVLGD